MKFFVTRTSTSALSRRLPCAEAKICATTEDLYPDYTIDIANLSALLTFVQATSASCIIRKLRPEEVIPGEPTFEIEIYDDYRE